MTASFAHFTQCLRSCLACQSSKFRFQIGKAPQDLHAPYRWNVLRCQSPNRNSPCETEVDKPCCSPCKVPGLLESSGLPRLWARVSVHDSRRVCRKHSVGVSGYRGALARSAWQSGTLSGQTLPEVLRTQGHFKILNLLGSCCLEGALALSKPGP